ncbi:MAG TPA: hypothetical protein PK696_01240 [bacterium]|nr:hypothetical protein [Chlamydiota bacterium]HOE26305.1 hypothetical protein [bacterium]HQM51843.1 hypothetical protein [bacterium]
MRRQFLIAALIFAGARCAWSAETVRPVTLPDLSIFPQLFVGVPLVLEQVELEWRIVKEFDYYCLGISVKEGERSRRAMERGEYVPPHLNRQRVTVVAGEQLAQELLDRMELDTVYPVKIWCTVGPADDLERELGNLYWVARVDRVDCYGADRTVAWTLPAPSPPPAAAPVAEAAPTLTATAGEVPVPAEPSAAELAQPAATEPVE